MHTNNSERIAGALRRAALGRRVVVIGGETHDWCPQPGALPLRMRDVVVRAGESLGLPTIWYRRSTGPRYPSDPDHLNVLLPRPSRLSDEIRALVHDGLYSDVAHLVVLDGIEHLVPTLDQLRRSDVLDLLQHLAVDSAYATVSGLLVLVEHQEPITPALRGAPGVTVLDLPLADPSERGLFLDAWCAIAGWSIDNGAREVAVGLSAGLRLDELHEALLEISDLGLGALADFARVCAAIRARTGLELVDPQADLSEPADLTELRDRVTAALTAGELGSPLVLPASAPHRRCQILAALGRWLRRPVIDITHPAGLEGLSAGGLRRLSSIGQSVVGTTGSSMTELPVLRALEQCGSLVVVFSSHADGGPGLGTASQGGGGFGCGGERSGVMGR